MLGSSMKLHHCAPQPRSGRRLSTVAKVAAPAANEMGCRIFYTKDGSTIIPMCADYGFRSGSGRLYEEHYGEIPTSVFQLAKDNFDAELKQLRCAVRFSDRVPVTPKEGILQQASSAVGNMFHSLDVFLEERGVLGKLEAPEQKSDFLTDEWQKIRLQLDQLTLDNDSVARFEEAREKRDGKLESPVWVKLPFTALCLVLDVVYDKAPIQKFWVLETVARIPYFAYISILHLYESMGFWRAGAELRKVHFAEEWNEMHHLQIMESLGGDIRWFDRFLGEHCALLYYWVLIGFYLVSPKLAYNFMERVEHHAADTYEVFLESNRELLTQIPPPYVALNYYKNEDLYLFDEFQKNSTAPPRRPTCDNLADVFTNIRDDELEHVKTMDACQKDTIAAVLLGSKDL